MDLFRIHARSERYNIPINEKYNTDNFFEGIINMTLNELIENEENIPQYMKDFYEETTLNDEWFTQSNEEKERILDDDLEKYMNSNYFTKKEKVELHQKYGNPDCPVEMYCLSCSNCSKYSFPCLNCAKYVFEYNLGCGNPENYFEIETPLDVFKTHKSHKEIKEMLYKQA